MQILKFPHPELFESGKEVTVFGPELKVLLDSMWDTMKANNGLGLAANQVSLLHRMFVMEGPKAERLYVINPKITLKSIGAANLKEGCLSAPGEFLVRSDRAAWVQVKFKNADNKEQVRVFSGLHAVCVQHEIEHLDGVSFMESKLITKSKRNQLAKKWGLK